MVLIVMGIAGSGKSRVGGAVAARWGVPLIEGDDLHPASNRRKMHDGIPLTDEDRWPWLRAIAQAVDGVLSHHGNAVVTCSALRQSYRDLLARPGVRFVYLKVSFAVARERLVARTGHFFGPELLQSQLDTLEEPQDAVTVNAEQPVESIIEELMERVGLGTDPGPGRAAV